ncbi:GIY-YIG nuclease family protein [Kitasatospora sp. NPDC001660]
MSAEPHAVRPRSVVYVIGSDQFRPVKVGTTNDLSLRLRALQGASPFALQVLWAAEGDRALELRIHQRLDRFRVRGEWFDFGDGDPVSIVFGAVQALAGGPSTARPGRRAKLRTQPRMSLGPRARRAAAAGIPWPRSSRRPAPRLAIPDRILALLEERGVVTTATLVDQLKARHSTVVTALRRLQKDGLATHIAHGFWAPATEHEE